MSFSLHFSYAPIVPFYCMITSNVPLDLIPLISHNNIKNKNKSFIINKHHQIYLASSKRHSLVMGLFNILICVLLCLLCTNPLLAFIVSLMHPIGQEFLGAKSIMRTRSLIKGFYEMGVIPLSLVYCTCFHPTFSSYVFFLSNSSGGSHPY